MFFFLSTLRRSLRSLPSFSPVSPTLAQVFWRKDNAWYAGVIEDQESTGDGGGLDDVILSKVAYDDGDVEVLDLASGGERVVLLTRADGSPASDVEDFESVDGFDDSDDDGLGGLAIPVSRRRAAKEGGGVEGSPPGEEEGGDEGGHTVGRGSGGGRGRGGFRERRRAETVGFVSRRAAAKEPPSRAPGSGAGFSDSGALMRQPPTYDVIQSELPLRVTWNHYVRTKSIRPPTPRWQTFLPS